MAHDFGWVMNIKVRGNMSSADVPTQPRPFDKATDTPRVVHVYSDSPRKLRRADLGDE